MENTPPIPAAISSVIAAIKRKIGQKTTNCKIPAIEKKCKTDENSTDLTVIRTKDATLNLRRVYKLIGFRMPKQHRFAYILYSLLMHGVVSVFFPVSCFISYCRLSQLGFADIDFGLVMTSVQLFLNLLACDFKMLVLVLMRHKWRSAYAVMERLDARCRQSPEEMREIRQLVREANRWVIIYIVAYVMYATSTAAGAYMKDRPSFNIFLPYLDYRASNAQFALVSFIELMLIYVACVQQAFDDSFAVVHVCTLRTHMRILLLRFAKLGSASMSLEENYEALKECIRDHKNYLELYHIVAPIVQTTVFVQFMLTAIILGITLVNFMIIATDFASRIGTFFYVVAVFMQITPVCYNAQCLMDDSNRLPVVIFHSNWIDQDVRYRKMLVFLMQRTQCTRDLMAGKLFPINLSCCLSIIKFSFTLFTFIKTIGLEDKFGNQN